MKDQNLSREILEILKTFPLSKEIIDQNLSKYTNVKLILKSLISELESQLEEHNFTLD